jgi:hypothetical protein
VKLSKLWKRAAKKWRGRAFEEQAFLAHAADVWAKENAELKKQLLEAVQACQLASVELERLTGDAGFEPERWVQRSRACVAVGRVAVKAHKQGGTQ